MASKENKILVSSKTLFSFMKEFKFLKEALKKGMWPRYNVEKNWDGKSFAIPMLSFCDIPLSLVKNHVQKYGCYGIGVTKEFARDHKMTPVLYLSNESHIMSKLNTRLKDYDATFKSQREMDIFEQIMYYVKKVSGEEDNEKGNYKYYDEREWRFVPEIDDKVHLELWNEPTKDGLEEYNNRTRDKRVKLNAKDISYIIVSRNSEIKDIIEVLKNIEYFSKDINRLCSRIITVEQIMNDF